MGAGLKKDLRVSRVGPGGSLNAFFVFSSGYFTRTCRGKEEGGNKHTWRAQYNGELYAAFGKDESLPKKNLLILSGSMAQLRQGKESKKHLTPSCMLHLARGDIAQLVELRSCNWVVAITGWMSNCPGVGVGGSPRVPSSGIPGEEDQVGPCEQLDALSPFNPLSEMWQRKENPWTDPIVSTP
ncbi:hypothetical protein H6P81_021278 [Aristolochia fimbriata]|uniref:Uncharacterized protein n=1 Tax=Aristolochia fimbriata TaxID=158543 RepID=A0AAV7DV00_ARIFI|nr:hypothetical protein H6P81_021278 [Aristolochia fimbriata]